MDEDPSISDILVVAADPNDPQVYIPHVDLHITDDLCDIDGYTCTCTEIPDVDPWTHRPTFDCPDYVDYENDVVAFNNVAIEYGYSDGWTPIPMGYWGFKIFLDVDGQWGYDSHEEWKFGLTLRKDGEDGEEDSYMDWCPVAGVYELSVDGRWEYRYIYRIPDNDETVGDIDVGDCFTPVSWDSTGSQGVFDPLSENQEDAPGFCVGEPYLNDLDYYERVIRILFFFADSTGDGCIDKDEFFSVVGFYDSNEIIAQLQAGF